eukprot:365344-Chlamydomonas_euryale.AAC.11
MLLLPLLSLIRLAFLSLVRNGAIAGRARSGFNRHRARQPIADTLAPNVQQLGLKEDATLGCVRGCVTRMPPAHNSVHALAIHTFCTTRLCWGATPSDDQYRWITTWERR